MSCKRPSVAGRFSEERPREGTPSCGGPASSAKTSLPGRVLAELRHLGAANRQELAGKLGVSTSSLNRVVAALLDARLVSESRGRAQRGALGRPRTVLALNARSSLTLGVHVGVRSTCVVAGDLNGAVLGYREFVTPADPKAAFDTVATALGLLRRAFPDREVLSAGLAIGGRLRHRREIVDHDDLGWHGVPIKAMFSAAARTSATITPDVDVMAEIAYREVGPGRPASFLYIYAGETTSASWIVDGVVRSEGNNLGSIGHVPTGSTVLCPCGRAGCLEVAVADRTLLDSAVSNGVLRRDAAAEGISALSRLAAQGNLGAIELLDRRSRLLGAAVRLLSDIISPDSIVVAGPSFTGYPPGVRLVTAAYAARGNAPVRALRFSPLGKELPTATALGSSLTALYRDPLTAVQPLPTTEFRRLSCS